MDGWEIAEVRVGKDQRAAQAEVGEIGADFASGARAETDGRGSEFECSFVCGLSQHRRKRVYTRWFDKGWLATMVFDT